jgi:hypothetical protein
MGIGPIVITLDANHPSARKLVIAANLQAPCHAAGVHGGGIAKEWVARAETGQNGEILLDPKAADVPTDVAARPVENVNGCGRWRRWVCWHADIGCD